MHSSNVYGVRNKEECWGYIFRWRTVYLCVCACSCAFVCIVFVADKKQLYLIGNNGHWIKSEFIRVRFTHTDNNNSCSKGAWPGTWYSCLKFTRALKVQSFFDGTSFVYKNNGLCRNYIGFMINIFSVDKTLPFDSQRPAPLKKAAEDEKGGFQIQKLSATTISIFYNEFTDTKYCKQYFRLYQITCMFN